jgi:CTD small phosphatase-like protein 2
VQLGIKFPTGEKIEAGVNIRPYAQMFLEELAKICEVVVFTASHECYANVVLNYLDPHKKLISHRLFREHCWQTE